MKPYMYFFVLVVPEARCWPDAMCRRRPFSTYFASRGRKTKHCESTVDRMGPHEGGGGGGTILDCLCNLSPSNSSANFSRIILFPSYCGPCDASKEMSPLYFLFPFFSKEMPPCQPSPCLRQSPPCHPPCQPSSCACNRMIDNEVFSYWMSFLQRGVASCCILGGDC